MIEKPLEQIGPADLQALVAAGRTEDRGLDYKQTLPGRKEADVKGFLADVTALANTNGGDIVYGMQEDGNGVAAELVGVDDSNLDEELLRLEDQARQGVDPRLAGFRLHPVLLGSGRCAVVLRVPASLLAPHRVAYANTSRFYGRHSRGNFEMDATQLRLAFAATSDLPRQMQDLHRNAIQAIGGQDMPCRLANRPSLIMTVAPLSVLREPRDLPVSRELAVLPPQHGYGYHYSVGLEGVVAYGGDEEGGSTVGGWCFTRRRGYIDAAWTIGKTVGVDDKRIYRDNVELWLPGMVASALARLRGFGIDGPWVAMTTLNGVENHRAFVGDGYATPAAWQTQPYLGQVIDEAMSADSLAPLIAAFWRVLGMETPPPRRS